VHEYHAARAVVESLASAVGPDASVVEVRARASPAFSAEALQQAYEMLVPGTPLAGSTLTVEELGVERECPGCGSVWALSRDDVAGHVVICPSCGALSGFDFAGGLEVVEVIRSE